MEKHELAIGALKMDCRVISYPKAVAGLQSTMDRALAGPFSERLARAVEPVLDGHDGVIRIRTISLDLAHTGPWNESVLAELLAARFAHALRQALESRSPDLRAWPNHVAYMASYIDMRLGFAYEPDWAFPDFEALRLLLPLQAAIEIVKARPAALAALARNGRRSGNPLRFVERLDAAATEHLVLHFLERAPLSAMQSGPPASSPLLEIFLEALGKTSLTNIDRAVLVLLCEADQSFASDDMSLAILTAADVVGLAVIAAEFERRNARALTFADLSTATGLIRQVLPPHLATVTLQMAEQAFARPMVERILGSLAKHAPQTAGGGSRERHSVSPGEGRALHLSSPLGGLALLLPDVVRLSLHRHLGTNGLRRALLSIPDADLRLRAEKDALIDFLFPEIHDADDPTFPPVPDIALARLAPESRGLINGVEGAVGWGDLLVASFSSRLPGLRASSRAYLQRQFFLVSGRAEITDAAVVVTLDGPPLAIILKMAGLSGDQMPVPHLNDRLLILHIGSGR
ncbi:hypothetical protein QO002_004364 [Pararhizobium capsulatum DSM 1112]|uniref:Uncharacterized protein n=1 Tax=Pararhizobium capsulatum DSM 1112 TaxID=1121113 RepID=A0ABU0BV84_9HYPH|nr:hypothetical protein [Pararhizobium capsulatum]MDQ0322158.1 hypothetical protein [Pararhizobium capsulatum DSM 1112]